MNTLSHTTKLEINLQALAFNYNYFKNKVSSNVKMLVALKAFAYGHGPIPLAKTLVAEGVDCIGVAYSSEGVALRKADIKIPVMVFYAQMQQYKSIIEHCLEPSIACIEGLKLFIDLATQNKLKQYPIHIKLNTGMNRFGFDRPEISKMIALLKQTSTVKVASIYTHLSASDDPNEKEFTHSQISLFKKMSDTLCDGFSYQPMLHVCNTSGIVNYPEAHFDMVRLGIGLYGISEDVALENKLQNVGSLKSVIAQIRTVEKEASVGYNRKFRAQKTTKIATIPIGYGDGFSRNFSNKTGWVAINGVNVPIVGNVCMDSLMVDVTDVDCNINDEVVLFNSQQTVCKLAAAANTITYELLTSISQRVPRVLVNR